MWWLSMATENERLTRENDRLFALVAKTRKDRDDWMEVAKSIEEEVTKLQKKYYELKVAAAAAALFEKYKEEQKEKRRKARAKRRCDATSPDEKDQGDSTNTAAAASGSQPSTVASLEEPIAWVVEAREVVAPTHFYPEALAEFYSELMRFDD